MIDSIINLIKPVAIPISWTLIHSLWQGLVIAGVLAAMLFILRSASSKFKYILALGAMGAILLSSVSTYYLYAGNHHYVETIEQKAIKPVTTASALIGLEQPAIIEEQITSDVESDSTNSYSALIWLFVFWIVGVLTLTIYNFISWQWTRYFATTLIQPISESWQTRFDKLCDKLKVNSAVRLIESKLIQSPCVIGWLKPIILVPAGVFTGFNPRYLEMILTHELAHINNNDILINYFQKLIETLYFFNPPVWWISRKIRQEREHCCDDLVINAFGDRLKYAHALADLEQFRQDKFGFALAAKGGSLISRIKRLIGKSDRANYRSGLGAVLATAFSLIVIFTACLFTGNSSEVAVAQTSDIEIEQQSIPPAKYSLRGNWDMAWYGERVDLKMIFRNGNTYSTTLWYDELVGLERKTDIKCTLVRDVGTIYFDGTMDKMGNECLGSGSCQFVASPEFFNELGKLGYSDSDDFLEYTKEDEKLSLAISNFTLEYARQIKQLGHDDLSVSDLIRLHNHGVTIEYIASLEKVGFKNLTSEQLLRMKDHGVDAYFIYTLQQNGYLKIQVDELIRCKDHGVNAMFIEKLKSLGYENLSLVELIKMKDHGVDDEYVEAISSHGYDDLISEDFVKLRDHGVGNRYIKELASLGYDNLSTGELIKLRDHGVTYSYIKEITESGYDKFTAEEIVKLRDHGVTGGLIKAIKKSGYSKFTAGDIAKLRDHGVDSDYLKDIANSGYNNFSAGDIAKLRDHNVTGELIKAIKKSSYNSFTAGEIATLRDHNVDGELIKALDESGYINITARDITRLRDHGANGSFIKQLSKSGFNHFSIEEIAKMRDYGVTGEYIDALAKNGYDDLSGNEIAKLQAYGITIEFIEEINESDYGGLTAEELIKLRQYGIDGDYLGMLADAGYSNIDLQLLVEMRNSGVDGAFINEVNDEYGRKLSPERLLNIKNYGYDY